MNHSRLEKNNTNNSDKLYGLILEKFLKYSNINYSGVILEKDFDYLYMRKGILRLRNYCDYHIYDGYCITIANISILPQKQRKGLFKNLLSKIREYCPTIPIFLENVNPDYLIIHLLKNGWHEVFLGNRAFPPSFIDNIKLLHKNESFCDVKKIITRNDLEKNLLNILMESSNNLDIIYKKLGINCIT